MKQFCCLCGNTNTDELGQVIGICLDAAACHRRQADRRYAKLVEAARRVVLNAYGTKPRHTRARDGGCRDDCIPCGIDALANVLKAHDATAVPSGD